MTISINLDDLTQEHIDRCAPFIGECEYDAPCIIGTLMPFEAADQIRAREFDDESIDYLVKKGAVIIPAEQEVEAKALQSAFDRHDSMELSRLLAKRGLAWPVYGKPA